MVSARRYVMFSEGKHSSLNSNLKDTISHKNYITNQLMLLTIFLSLATVTLSLNQRLSCLYLQHVNLEESSNMVFGSSYNFPITWSQTQTDLAAGGLGLAGFWIENANSYLSYNAVLTNVTSAGATIVVTPLEASTAIYQLRFDVFFGKTSCSTRLEVVSQTFTPTVINAVPRSSNSEQFTLSHSNVPGSSTLKIITSLQAFTVASVDTSQEFDLTLISTVNLNNGNFKARVQSTASSGNSITSVTITAIVLEESSFPNPIFIQQLFPIITSRQIVPQYTFSNLFPTQVGTVWCSFTLYDIEAKSSSHSDTPKVLYREFQGHLEVDYVIFNMAEGRYRISCLLECDDAYQLEGTSPYSCYKCSDEVSGCQICNNKASCQTWCNATVPSCTSCDYQGHCSGCSNFYTAYQSDNCWCANDPNCETCSSLTYCQTCKAGFVRSGRACHNCSQAIANCIDCSSISVCTNCSTGYFINSSDHCEFCSLSNCDTCLSATNCSACASGYLLNSTFGCQTCGELITNCQTCASASVCSVCASTHVLNNANTTCEVCSLSNCDTCDTVSTCSVCASGYLLNSSFGCQTCPQIIPDCLTCPSATECSLCAADRFFNSTSIVCHACSLPNCDTCTTLSTCSTCASGYLLNSSSGCQTCGEIITDCQTCASASVCSACVSDRFLNNGNTTCEACSLSGCRDCATISTCSFCYNGYLLNSSQLCQLCSELIPSCVVCSSTSTCSACAFNYFPNSGNTTCEPCQFTNCRTCDSLTTCAVCNSGYTVVTTNNGSICYPCSVPNCQSCQTLITCQICQVGFTLGAGNNTCDSTSSGGGGSSNSTSPTPSGSESSSEESGGGVSMGVVGGAVGGAVACAIVGVIIYKAVQASKVAATAVVPEASLVQDKIFVEGKSNAVANSTAEKLQIIGSTQVIDI